MDRGMSQDLERLCSAGRLAPPLDSRPPRCSARLSHLSAEKTPRHQADHHRPHRHRRRVSCPASGLSPHDAARRHSLRGVASRQDLLLPAALLRAPLGSAPLSTRLRPAGIASRELSRADTLPLSSLSGVPCVLSARRGCPTSPLHPRPSWPLGRAPVPRQQDTTRRSVHAQDMPCLRDGPAGPQEAQDV